MIGAPNSLNLNCKVPVMKEAPGPLVSEEIADIFTNYNIDTSNGHQGDMPYLSITFWFHTSAGNGSMQVYVCESPMLMNSSKTLFSDTCPNPILLLHNDLFPQVS